MYRLGLRLTLRGGREALIRLVLTAVAVAVGVTVLLAVFADYHAFEATSSRPCWECTQPAQGHPAPSSSELWNYSENLYRGRFIEELDVAALGPGAPVPPGLSRLPAGGQYYASPALATLLRTVPPDELGDRFPGRQVGLVGDQALSGPDELVVVVGYSPSALARLPGTFTVNHIADSPEIEGTTGIYRMAFGIGAIAVLFPLLVLINSATRLAAARREERYAAMRLVGATPSQVSVISSVEAVVSALCGAVLGAAIFLLVRPPLADISFSGARFFSAQVTPTAAGYALMLMGVPLASAAASLWALRRVRITPVGVSRKVRRRPPGVWRVVPLLVGVPLFIVALPTAVKGSENNGLVFVGFALIMIGLVVGGTWLTMQAARLLGRSARRAASLLAARRLADNPKSSFRTVSGLVLAVFVGTVIAALVPAFSAAETTLGGARSISNVLRVPYSDGPGSGLPPARSTQLMAKLRTFAGVTVVPIYANPLQSRPLAPPPPPPPPSLSSGGPQFTRRVVIRTAAPSTGAGQYDSIVVCQSFDELPTLGRCSAGAKAVYANVGNVRFTDNPLSAAQALPLVGANSPKAPENTSHLDLEALLVKTNSTSTLEQMRTFLTVYDLSAVNATGAGIDAWQMGEAEPETFGEVAQIRNNDINNVETVVLAIVALTLLVAACSLAVTVGGGIVERKRPFTLLRVSGTSRATLYKVVLIESFLPLIGAAVLAAGVAIAITEPLVKALPVVKKVADLAFPGTTYYLAMAGGLLVAFLIVCVTLPILNRVTGPDKVRFE